MVKIRFARFGAKKHAFYHIVVTDSENARDGRYIEHIGHYDPSKPMAQATYDRDRLTHWVGRGAQLSESLAKVIREQTRANPAAPAAAAS
ncbi:MAG TPA: 30S ribosomal protein S16 [Polyangiales bacterium]|jgi:small subunit ribosomal protein S16|nr:30S ribosomal protein S16 [Polyangiales bacterium]